MFINKNALRVALGLLPPLRPKQCVVIPLTIYNRSNVDIVICQVLVKFIA